ncbi:hypothetical protein PG997_011338 [Apiospora hydei]|uniref:Uncharacterized protein n=1 Tax=Apiospora hydei TaxID=1337664 RepID=A0ABR1VLM9_9PEZI
MLGPLATGSDFTWLRGGDAAGGTALRLTGLLDRGAGGCCCWGTGPFAALRADLELDVLGGCCGEGAFAADCFGMGALDLGLTGLLVCAAFTELPAVGCGDFGSGRLSGFWDTFSVGGFAMGAAGFGLSGCFNCAAACGVFAELSSVGGAGSGLVCDCGCGCGDVSLALAACSSGSEELYDLDLRVFPMRRTYPKGRLIFLLSLGGGRGGANSHGSIDGLRGLRDLRVLGRLGGLAGSGDSDKCPDSEEYVYPESEDSSSSEYSDSDGDVNTGEDRLVLGVLGGLCGRGVRGILLVLTGLFALCGFGRFEDFILILLLSRDLCFRRCLVDEDSPVNLCARDANGLSNSDVFLPFGVLVFEGAPGVVADCSADTEFELVSDTVC